MPETHSRAGKRVERVSVNDSPHERYRGYDPWTGEELKRGIPILTSTPSGNIVEKNVTYKVIKCPECEKPSRYTDSSEPVCPECGIVCGGEDQITSDRMVRDAKAAGRVDGDTAGSSA